MKKIFTFLIILIFVVFNISTANSNSESKRIQTLIKYVDTKISDLEKISNKYDLNGDIDINKRLKKLKEINNILVKTKTSGEYNNYIPEIIEQLKDNNNLIKEQLKVKIEASKIEWEKYSALYLEKISPIIKKINKITVDIAKKLMKKDKLSPKDGQIVWILILVKQKLVELENITEKKWNSKKEVKDYILSNFKQITNNFRQIKNISKSTN